MLSTTQLCKRAYALPARTGLYRTLLKPTFTTTSPRKAIILTSARSFTSTPLSSHPDQPKTIEKPDTSPNSAFLKTETPQIFKTKPTWPHPPFSESEMKNEVIVAHRETRTTGDKVAFAMVRLLRWGMDWVSGYKRNMKAGTMTEEDWLRRIVFLESIAGVPGMVAGMLRHLRSLRVLRRDNGWIETLLEEAFNERMHLLTFLKLSSPGLFMRTLLLGAQGIFFNAFFLSYLISPSTCHRFVGYIEEEAVLTYSHIIADLEAGKLPLWAKMQAPEIAVEYWDMPEGKRGMRDLLLYVRADEAKHREVNHTLGNLRGEDPNPFVAEWRDDTKPHPSKALHGNKATGWERHEAL